MFWQGNIEKALDKHMPDIPFKVLEISSDLASVIFRAVTFSRCNTDWRQLSVPAALVYAVTKDVHVSIVTWLFTGPFFRTKVVKLEVISLIN